MRIINVCLIYVGFLVLAACNGKDSLKTNDSPLEGQFAYARFAEQSMYSVYMGGIIEFLPDGRYEDNRFYRFYENYDSGIHESEYRVVYKGVWSIDGDTLRFSLSESPRIEYVGHGNGYYGADVDITDNYAPKDCKLLSTERTIVIKDNGGLLELYRRDPSLRTISDAKRESDSLLITERGFGRYGLFPYYNEHRDKAQELFGDQFSIEVHDGMYDLCYEFTFKGDSTVAFCWEDGNVRFYSPKFHTPSGLHVGSTVVDFLFVNGFSKKCQTTKYEPTWVTDGTYCYHLSDDVPVSTHYVEGDYWASGDITNLNAVITEIVISGDK